jgi:hypothetical protein
MNVQEEFEYMEHVIHELLDAYSEAHNKSNKHKRIEYDITITVQKMPTQMGVKSHSDVAYLRLVKLTTKKGEEKTTEDLIFHTAHVFKDIGERTKDPWFWKLKLYSELLFRLLSGGLEYADFLRVAKQTIDEKTNAKGDSKEPQKVHNSGVGATKPETNSKGD